MIEREEDRGFTISDRRGATRERPSSDEPSPPSSAATSAEPTPHQEHADHGAVGPPDFSGLLLSLASSALIHLGAPAPDGTTSPVNLPRAQEMIDLLGVLEEKTKGNLTSDESALLGNILYNLRLRYVEHAR